MANVEVLENCQLEWNKDRQVLYVHNKDTGATVLRICNLRRENFFAPTGLMGEGQIDITGPFRHASFPEES